MKRFIIILSFLTLLNCKKDPKIFIGHLNGYWEIEKVITASGEERTYNFNETIDYFSVSDSLTGLRKKLKPSLDGTYTTSNNAETFILKIEHDSLNIYYKTKFSSWKETILMASENELKIINENKDLFLYKPYKPLNLN